MQGQTVQDLWTDVPPINNRSRERLGYPTQKPVALLERIIQSSTNEGDVVLDPFCGCGTTIDAAEKHRRRWIGIDITYLAIDLIEKRLRHTYGSELTGPYQIRGIPHDLGGAKALFEANPFDFERWAVSRIDGQPNQKQTGDKGIDGIVRFPLSQTETGRIIISVKGGKHVAPTMVREIGGTVESQRAQMGVLITMDKVTAEMRDQMNRSGIYQHPLTGVAYPKIQVVTVADLLDGKRPNMPTAILPYVKAKAREADQPTLGL